MGVPAGAVRSSRQPAAPAPADSPRGDAPPRDWLAIGVVIALALAAGLAQWWLLRDLRQLPSPLFGGDYTYQMGCIRSILASGNPMASCSCSGALPGYLPVYGTLAALLVRVTGLPVLEAMFLLSVLAHAASALAVAWVVGRHVGSRAGVVVACVWAVVYEPAVLRYTEFTAQVVIPFFFDALLRWVREARPRHAVRLGIVLAVLGYAHAVAFVAAIMVTGLCGLAVLAGRMRTAGLVTSARRTALELGIAAAGATLALGYWYRPLFVYHGRTSLHYTEWNGGPSLGILADRLSYAAGAIGRLVKLDTPATMMLHALFLLGIVTLLAGSVRRRFAAIAIAGAATFVWMFHFFATMPLFQTHFVPEYVRSMLWAFVLALVAAIPVTLVLERLPRRASAIVMLAALAAAGVGLVSGAHSIQGERLMQAAREPHAPVYEQLGAWARAHTAPDDVLLSTNELSFAWAGLTGRKTLVTRRAQNDGFLDMDVRNRDAAVILYGDDDPLRRELLRRWRVRWLLWTSDWVSGDFGMLDSTRFYKVDPLFWFRDAAHDDAAMRAGVKLIRLNDWVDPAMQSPLIPRFEMSLVSPLNYQRPDRPWRPALDTLLEEAWTHEEQGRRVATLYRVRE